MIHVTGITQLRRWSTSIASRKSLTSVLIQIIACGMVLVYEGRAQDRATEEKDESLTARASLSRWVYCRGREVDELTLHLRLTITNASAAPIGFVRSAGRVIAYEVTYKGADGVSRSEQFLSGDHSFEDEPSIGVADVVATPPGGDYTFDAIVPVFIGRSPGSAGLPRDSALKVTFRLTTNWYGDAVRKRAQNLAPSIRVSDRIVWTDPLQLPIAVPHDIEACKEGL